MPKSKSGNHSWVNRQIESWAEKRIQPSRQSVLGRKNILILPTANGLMFVLAGAVIFFAAINYENSLAFGLAFLMASIFVIAMIHGFINLRGLVLRAMTPLPVFCGEEAAFPILVARQDGRQHESIEIHFVGSTLTRCNLIHYDQDQLSVYCKTHTRGVLPAPLMYVRSYFPTGLFRAWAMVRPDSQCLVYPRPVAAGIAQLLQLGAGDTETALVREGTSDYFGLRAYTPGDSMKQVAWKNVARGQGMQVKQFIDYVDERLWLDWNMFPGLGTEERLSRLCYCVLKLSATTTDYGIRLPGLEIAPGKGSQHRTAVLEGLAMYRHDDALHGPGEGS